MVPHNLLLGELERYGSEVWAIQWIRNWLDAHSNRIEVKSVMSGWKAVMSGVRLEVCVGTGALQHVYQWIERVGSSAPSAIFADDTCVRSTLDARDGGDALQRTWKSLRSDST